MSRRHSIIAMLVAAAIATACTSPTAPTATRADCGVINGSGTC